MIGSGEGLERMVTTLQGLNGRLRTSHYFFIPIHKCSFVKKFDRLKFEVWNILVKTFVESLLRVGCVYARKLRNILRART